MTVSPSTATREAGTSQPARRRVRRRLSVSHILIGLAVALAFALNLLALQDRDRTVMVAVADGPLAAGSALGASDVRYVPLDADFEALDGLVQASQAGELEGRVLERSLEEGELIGLGALAEPAGPGGLRSMSVPIDPGHAAGGAIAVGDRVDVISVADGVAAYVVIDVEVVGVSEDGGGGLGGLGGYHLVLAVDADEALALAAAIDSGSLEVIRSTGAAEVSQEPEADDS